MIDTTNIMNFSELDSFNDCTKLCNAISMLPNMEEKAVCCGKDSNNCNCDEDECEDEIIKFKAMPTDPETAPANSYVNVAGNLIDQNKAPIFGCSAVGKYGCAPITLSDAEKIIEQGCGIKNILTQVCDEGKCLGYESPYNVGDLVKMKDENIPHIFIIVSTEGPNIELAKPTANRSEFRTIGGGVWPRSVCTADDIGKKVCVPMDMLEYIITSNDNTDADILSMLCPGCVNEPVSCTAPLNESLTEDSLDMSPVTKAKKVRMQNMADKTPNNIQPTIFDENGKLKANTEEIFDEINSRMNEIWGEPYQSVMKNPYAKCNSVHAGGPEVITSSKPIQFGK